MNDFTKEELSELRGILIAYGVQGESLELKVKSMIDNYCEHPESKSFINCCTEYCLECKKEIE